MKKLANEAHGQGLAIGLKNALDILDSVADVVDFAVNEQCVTKGSRKVLDIAPGSEGECGRYNKFTAAGKNVFHIEYGTATQTSIFCVNKKGFSTVIKRQNQKLDDWVQYCNGSDVDSPDS
jgi:endo-alpha-1,4-polygalactosaminidase (GH114 family)